jgi:SAM-dependent methyltransferase
VNLTTLDLNPHCGADLQCDLNAVPPWVVYPSSQLFERGGANVDLLSQRAGLRLQAAGMFEQAWLLESDYWDEIHAYEVLEHLGQQGDAASFLGHFSELYRLLKPNGYLCATVPSTHSKWLWGDPSHRRVINECSLVFLDQEQYQAQIDRRVSAGQAPTNMSDFRDSLGYRADFKLIDQHDNRSTFTFIVQAVKPSRYEPYVDVRNDPFYKEDAADPRESTHERAGCYTNGDPR